ncbi:hypothetical protein RRG08_053331 [Elysia crispata]|uniref:Uncharacterized protein n=1 Tax=Elysia crispata TaxID=231223 RepID=A0AAE0ZKK1_9GAST|nr:hypothetical protein RRG08_053331 [Elysia crispata]
MCRRFCSPEEGRDGDRRRCVDDSVHQKGTVCRRFCSPEKMRRFCSPEEGVMGTGDDVETILFTRRA